MDHELEALRRACKDYPRSNIVDAVFASLGAVVADTAERRGLAAFVAAWLTDDEAPEPSLAPPLDGYVVTMIHQELRRRSH